MAFYKMMLLRCHTQYASKSGNLSSGQRTRRGQFSFQTQRRAIALMAHGNVVMLKILQVSLQQFVSWELPIVQAGVSKRQRNKRSNSHHSLNNRLSRDSRKKKNLLHWLCPSLWLCGSQQTVKNSSWNRWEYQTTYLPPEKPVCKSRSTS